LFKKAGNAYRYRVRGGLEAVECCRGRVVTLPCCTWQPRSS
jgi:hypothetical protein